MSDSCLICIVIAPAVEDIIVDWLLTNVPGRGFTCVPAYGHGEDPDRMSTTEKIVGHTRHVQLQIQCATRAEADSLLGQLAAAFPAVGMHYWIQAVIGHGRLGHDD